MKTRRSAEQIVGLLRQADVDLGKGSTVPDVCRRLGISQQTDYRWRTKFGGMDPRTAKQLEELQKETWKRSHASVADRSGSVRGLEGEPHAGASDLEGGAHAGAAEAAQTPESAGTECLRLGSFSISGGWTTATGGRMAASSG